MKRSTRWRDRLTVPAVVGLLVLGAACNSRGGRVSVKGTVTVDGRPLAKGVIVFVPEGGEPGQTLLSAEVVDGRFELPARFEPKSGTYRVQITAARQTGRWVDGVAEIKETLPAKFHEKSTLTVDLRPGGEDLTLDLNSKG
jgi:hypothetical protein